MTYTRRCAAGAVVAIAMLSTGVASAQPDTGSAGAPIACAAPAPGVPNGKKWPSEPKRAIDPTARYNAVLHTNCGPITVTLNPGRAPRTVNSFAFLAGQQYFDHTRCHRLTTRSIYVLQCGDPTATGTGGPGYRFPDENLAGAVYPAGTVAMANAGPGTNGSQFFLVYRDTTLPPNYTPFGRVTGGLDALQRIGAAGVANNGVDGSPAANVVLNSVVIARG